MNQPGPDFATTTVYFQDGKLVRVEMLISYMILPKGLLAHLTEKFGKPSSMEETTEMNRFGAKFVTWYPTWEKETFWATAILPDGDYASVSLMTREEHAAQKKAEAAKQKNPLN